MPNIIILDDDVDFAEALLESLSLLLDDYKFTLCTRATELFLLLESTPVDLVITDIIMPNIDGIEVVTKLRKKKPELPLITMSGGGRIGANDYLHISKILGAKATFEKPFSIIEMSRKIEELTANQ